MISMFANLQVWLTPTVFMVDTDQILILSSDHDVPVQKK